MTSIATAPNTTVQDPALTAESKMMMICERAFESLDLTFDLSIIRSKSRMREYVTMRRLTARILFDAGYGATLTGRFMNQDHTTVLHYRRTSHLLKEVPSYDRKVIQEKIDHHKREIERLTKYLEKYD